MPSVMSQPMVVGVVIGLLFSLPIAIYRHKAVSGPLWKSDRSGDRHWIWSKLKGRLSMPLSGGPPLQPRRGEHDPLWDEPRQWWERLDKRTGFGIFVVRTTKGQERSVSRILASKASSMTGRCRGTMGRAFAPKGVEGYVFVESSDIACIDDLVAHVRHAKARTGGMISPEALESMVAGEPVSGSLHAGDTVEVTAGAFTGLRSRIAYVYRLSGNRSELVLGDERPIAWVWNDQVRLATSTFSDTKRSAYQYSPAPKSSDRRKAGRRGDTLTAGRYARLLKKTRTAR